ncbi:MAG TPA: hypothetical protein VMV69_03070 [Pirellulales bacterium]|nr:hypothetical protein [Pirellulales bacterium]
MLVTVKAREVQRGMLAEMAGDPGRAACHFLAAAHLELVLVNDYGQASQDEMAFRSSVSAASCFWRAGRIEQARTLFRALTQEYPAQAGPIQDAIAELEVGWANAASSTDEVDGASGRNTLA